MPHRYKPLREQTIVLTGATSGIGLATARRAAKAGARLVLVARNEQVLRELCEQVQRLGGQAAYVVADVGREDQVEQVVAVAKERFGGFDTWINNAGVVIFSRLDELPVTDHQRLFETNYWGVVYGSRAAVAHMRTRADGGTLINIASINAEMPVPILGAYSASKAAVKAYSDVLRMELADQGAPVRVAVLKPSGISTPISAHGRSHTGERGKVMPPLYDVEVAASAVLAAAQRPIRELTVGETGRLSEMFWHLFPKLSDRVIGWALPRVQSSGQPPLSRDNLYQAGDDGEVYLNGQRKGLRWSPYTDARIYTWRTLGLAGLLSLGACAAWCASRGMRRRPWQP
ncbi:SDR family oxidoreductase [Orrella sp. JC864]|uniref:SDR family oxidoreductase n=1 Tax=Orrella sp. JC864 TaxID=3120298 RepID=UPI0012BC15B5